jgi:superfamily II RNA helicase
MKKKGQANTLFQAWGGSKEATKPSGQTSSHNAQPGIGEAGSRDATEVLDLCDEDEDDDLILALAMSEVDSGLSHQTGNAGRVIASTSASMNYDQNKIVFTKVNRPQKTLFSHTGFANKDTATYHNQDPPIHTSENVASSSPPRVDYPLPECDLPGFSKFNGRLLTYPTNYPVRDYQLNIVQSAIHRNTLVCLPTGLGKTFIAAVVMYNFYMWYPSRKVVFMAPTKPLVAQQIEACYNIMGIPQSDTAEMTGMYKYM